VNVLNLYSGGSVSSSLLEKNKTYRIIVATQINTMLSIIFLQWSCFLSKGWLRAPQCPAHLQQQKKRPAQGRIASRMSPIRVRLASPP